MLPFLLLLCTALILGPPVVGAQSPSTVISFEDGQSNALPPGWVWIVKAEGGEAGLDEQVVYSGKHALSLSGSRYVSIARVGANPISGLQPVVGERYKVSVWIRSDKLDADAWVKFEVINAERNRVLGNFFLRPEQGSHDWYLLQGVTPTVPADTAELWLNINLGGTGRLWIDEVTVEPWQGSDEELEKQFSGSSPTALPTVTPPPADEVSRHPSILFRADEVEELRKARKRVPFRQFSELILSQAAGMLVTPLPEEPEPYPDGWEVNHWREMRTVASQASGHMETLAFAYLITGNERYAQEAKRWIMHVCSWDVNGTTSTAYHDDLGRWLLCSMSGAVDWIYDTLTAEDLAVIRPVLLARGRELYRLQVRPLSKNPYDSHAVSALCYLTRVALVLQDLPEAQEWLDFTAQFYSKVYPPWGGSDGGWSEGVGYWKWSMTEALEAAELLKVARVVDLYSKDWYKNTAYYKMYFQPLGSKFANGFGDGATFDTLLSADYTATMMLATATGDPYVKWYAQQLQQRGGVWFDEYWRAYYWFFRYGDQIAELPATSLAELPRSKAFYDIGQVAMHSNLEQAKEDVSLYFKSSPLGSVSHSHGEQNSFTLTAWNEPLAISSGWYDWYGSDHHFNFNRQTRSKNTILVDGQGQHFRHIAAAGEITDFHTGAGYDFTTGEAAQAYAGKLERFRREILYCVPDYFLVIDDLEAPRPVHFNWLLHTISSPQIDEGRRVLELEQNGVHFQAHFLTPSALQFELSDRYYTSGDALSVFKEQEALPETEQPAQYHMAATTIAPDTQGYFVTVLYPYQGPAPALDFSGACHDSVYEVRAVGDGRLDTTLISRNGQATTLSSAGIEAEGAMVSVSWRESRAVQLLLKAGRSLLLADGLAIAASEPCTVSIQFFDEGAQAIAELATDTSLRIRLPDSPRQVSVNGDASSMRADVDGYVTLELPAGKHVIDLSS